MTVGIAHVTFVAAALLAAGAYVTFRDRDVARSPGLLLMIAAAALELAGASRFAASTRDPLTGQAFAIVLLLLAPGLTALFAAARAEEP